MHSKKLVHVIGGNILASGSLSSGSVLAAYLTNKFRSLHPLHKSVEFIPAEKIQPGMEIILTDPLCLSGSLPGSVKWVHSTWAGADGYLANLNRPVTYKLTRSAIYGRIIAEYVLGQLISSQRNFSNLIQLSNRNTWDREGAHMNYSTLRNKKAVILGYGDIGSEISRMLASATNTSTVAGLVRKPRLTSEPQSTTQFYTDIDELISNHASNVDFLINCLFSNHPRLSLYLKKIFKLMTISA